MVLQQLVSTGQLRVSDCLLDDNNIVLNVCIMFIVNIFPVQKTTKIKCYKL